jgi:hypothetical protein
MAPITADVRAKVEAALKAGGKTKVEIARAFNLSPSAVYRVAKRLRSAEVEDAQDAASVGSAASETSVRPEAVQEFHRTTNAFASDLGLEADEADVDVDQPSGKAAETEAEQKAAEQILRQQVLAGSGIAPPNAPPAMRNLVLRDRIPDSFAARFAGLEESAIDRGHVIQRIMFNCEHFAPLIRQIIGQDTEAFIQTLPSKTDRELDSLLQIIERTRSVGNLANTFKHTFYAAATGGRRGGHQAVPTDEDGRLRERTAGTRRGNRHGAERVGY